MADSVTVVSTACARCDDMTRPQTIQIFLPSGDPQGIRIAEITTRIVRVIEVPRSLLASSAIPTRFTLFSV